MAANTFAAKIDPARAWDVATLDRLLAQIPPGANTVQAGDMEILARNVRAWRNQLAGEPIAPSAFDGAIPAWPSGIVYYQFDPNVSELKQRAFRDAADEWATFAQIRFVARRGQTNYVHVSEDPSISGGMSGVGMIGGMQAIRIGPSAWNRHILCHEIGHALGLIHEHQRSDRDNFITVLAQNFDASNAGNFVKLGNSLNHGAYDFLSVMHYSRNDASKDRATLNTLEPLPAYAKFLNVMGVRHDTILSAGDRAGMAEAYGPGPALGSVVTATADSGPGSLRAALYFAADNFGAKITFNIPATDPSFSEGAYTIQLTDELPALANNTTIQGALASTPSTTAPSTLATAGSPSIRLTGFRPPIDGTFPSGLRLRGTNNAVTGLFITGFAGSGVILENGAISNRIGGAAVAERNILSGNGQFGALVTGAGTRGNLIVGNYVGTTSDGSAALSNAFDGIHIEEGSLQNTIASNLVSGNGGSGILIRNSHQNVMLGNLAGVDATGSSAISNTSSGIQISRNSDLNVIGGLASSDRNVISGNGWVGISITGEESEDNMVIGNYIGVNQRGDAPVYQNTGIAIGAAARTRVGGSNPSARNIISGNIFGLHIEAGAKSNTISGNYVGLNALGNSAIPNEWGLYIESGAISNLVGGTEQAARNVISGNKGYGIFITGANTQGNFVRGNYIGTDPSGLAKIPNGFIGVLLITGAQSNWIGGPLPNMGNVISGNGSAGVSLYSGNNFVQGNYIGLNAAGTDQMGNSGNGIQLALAAQNNLVGGPGDARNYIAGNAQYGVALYDTNTAGNQVQGNVVGLNVTGQTVSNNFAGVLIANGASSNLIGGASAGLGNIVSGNGAQGILITGENVADNRVQNNRIGLDLEGRAARPNRWPGVEVSNGAHHNFVGGDRSVGNIISGNNHNGVIIYGAGANSNWVQGNVIGLNAARQFVPNLYAGVAIAQGAQGNLIGGEDASFGNTIAGNGADGIQIADAATFNNTVRANSFFGNKGTGLQFYLGANKSMAAPTLTASTAGRARNIQGTFSGAPNATYQIDFYASSGPVSLAEGKSYLGAQMVSTSAEGTASFSATFEFLPLGNAVAATATDAAGNTSAMSASISETSSSLLADGLSDGWRAFYFGGSGSATNSQSCAACDPDHDGASNLNEFLVGTNPADSASVLKLDFNSINDLRAGRIEFTAMEGALYRIEARDASDAGNWSVVADQIVGTGNVFQLVDPNFGLGAKKFYRIDLLR